MNAWMIVLLIPMVQESTALKWNLKKDQVFTCTWTHHIKTGAGKTDIRFELSGELLIRDVSGVGAEALLAIGKLVLTSKDGDKVSETHFEKGKLVKPEAPGENDKRIAEWCATPARLKITSWGAHSLTDEHFVKVLFDAQADCFGTHLPDKSFKTGDTWEGWSETMQLKALNLRPVKVTCKLESLKNDLATIVVKDRQRVKARGFELDFSTVSEARFHPAAGYCSYYSIQTTSMDVRERRDLPDKPDVSVILTFEMKEKK